MLNTTPRPRDVVLLGAQRFDSTLGSVVRGLDCDGPIALITAGWRDREDEDEELRNHLACKTVNLRLYHRSEEVNASDPELARAHRAKQTKLRHKQDFYRIRLEHELAANHVIRQRQAPPEVLEEEEGASLAAIRQLDSYHVAQCQRVHAQFELAEGLYERPVIKQHREQLAEALAGCNAVAIAGGHVAALLNRMRLFGIRELLGDQSVFAWSGGGMVVSERIVLFHDSPPQGPGASEVLGAGLGLVPGVVMLPHPNTRLRLADPERVSLLARRFEPAQCLAFPEGAHVTQQGGKLVRPSAVVRLCEDGSCMPFEEQPS
jgi:peptidase E